MDERRIQLNKMLCTKSYTLAFLPMDSDLNMSYGVDVLKPQSNNDENHENKNDGRMGDQNNSSETGRDRTSVAGEILEDDENI